MPIQPPKSKPSTSVQNQAPAKETVAPPTAAPTNAATAQKKGDKFALEKTSQPTAQAAAPFKKPDWSSAKMETLDGDVQTLAYTVDRGDRLGKIAKRFGTDVPTMSELNELENPDVIKPGQKLQLPQTFHVAKEGETYSSVAKRTGIDAKELIALNAGHSDALEPGQEIWVPAADSTPEEAQTRASLIKLMENAAEADSRLLYGPGELTATTRGNVLGWGDGGETSTFLYSDDYRSMQSDRDEHNPDPVSQPLDSPVEDTRHMLVDGAISSVAWQAYSKAKEANPNVKEPEQSKLDDGRFKYVVDDGSGFPKTVFYDPSNDGMVGMSPGAELAWVSPASLPTEVVDNFAKYLGLQLPITGAGE